MDTGTAVTFFFTCDTDLFFAVALLSSRGQLGRGGSRRVLTFPSGFLGFGGKFDLKLFVDLGGLGLSRSLGGFLVGTGEDAEGHGNAGFKVQVGDLIGARILFPTTFRTQRTKGRSRRFLLLFFLNYLKEKKGGEEAAVLSLTSRLDSFWQMRLK
ncbi:hypothetical protein F5Y03DRAFT_122954 [Xylaria venustula]|nr:hypothetical protein F5Y03DRAFT_122954 [Xylaria venustula]